MSASLSAVIVNYRTPALVESCVAALLRTGGALEIDVVVVDNGSGDGSAERLNELPGARLLALPENRGFAAGVNVGARATSAPYLLILNPDTIARPGAPTALVDHLRNNPRAGIAAPVLENEDGSPQLSAYRRFPTLGTLFCDFCLPVGHALHGTALHPHNLPDASIAGGGPVTHATGAALAVRRSAYDQAGPLDESFFLYMEETEWQQRMTGAGWGIDLVPAARFVHAVRGGGPESEIPSSHYLPSAYRYFAIQGRSERAVTTTLTAALAVTRASLWVASLWPPSRAKARRMSAGYRSLWDYVRRRRRARASSARS